jgi:hypothetical protein
MAHNDYVPLRTTVARDVDRALANLVALSGVAKAAIVREALSNHLAARGALPPTTPDTPATPTRGRGLAYRNKEFS